jgi:hypothetical protein
MADSTDEPQGGAPDATPQGNGPDGGAGNDQQNAAPERPAAEGNARPEPPAPKPPWGSPEEFQPERAWKLIQNLKSDIESLKPLAQKGKDLEDASKTELDRLRERAEAAEKVGTDTSSKLWRLEIALEKGLSKSQAKRLVGSTREELESDADELLNDLGAAAAKKEKSPTAKDVLPSKPNDGQKSGGTDTADPKRIAREALAHYR